MIMAGGRWKVAEVVGWLKAKAKDAIVIAQSH